jgi:predicted Zn-dependent protease with MMP-like domain
MDHDAFGRVVEEALGALPEPFARRLENVAIVVQDETSPEDLEDAGLEPGEELFGLYVGTPLTDRFDYHMVLPDRILIFQGPHVRHFPPEELAFEIRKTVAHEIAHFFGIDDDRLHEMGMG